MTKLTLTRRRLLAGLGTIGVASAGVGFGSVGYLTDRERVPNVTTAGTLDFKLGYRSTYNGDSLASAPGEDEGVDCDTPGLVDGAGVPVVELADVKPGDCGMLTTTLYVCGNPSRLWVAVDVADAAENDRRPEEVAAGDGTVDAGELQALVDVTVRVADDRVVYAGTLAGLATAAGSGLLLTRDDDGPTCVAETLTVTVDWCLPLDGSDHNRAITDSVAFYCRFAAVQCRHDPDGWNPFESAADGGIAAPANETTTG
jgi:hypothetical protein